MVTLEKCFDGDGRLAIMNSILNDQVKPLKDSLDLEPLVKMCEIYLVTKYNQEFKKIFNNIKGCLRKVKSKEQTLLRFLRSLL